jgi:hypothetical protein
MPVYKNNTEERITETVKDTNGTSISFAINSGETLETTYILTDSDLTLISEAPYYNPLQAAIHEVTSTGVGNNQTVSINRNTKTISVFNSSGVIVDIYLRSLSNTPPLKSYPNTERLISVGSNVNQLICVFPSAATIYIEERK